MSNGYTTVPSVIPGNVTIQGVVTATGGGVFGSGAAKARIGDYGSLGLGISSNLGFDGGTLDTNTKDALFLGAGMAQGHLLLKWLDTAGNSFLGGVSSQSLAVGSPTGPFSDTALHTVGSSFVPGFAMGPQGTIHLFIHWNTTTQGATNSNVIVTLGGTQLVVFGKNTTGSTLLLMIIQNAFATNSQVNTLMNLTAQTSNLQRSTSSVDTSVNQTLTVAMQNGSATDVQTVGPLQAIITPDNS